MLCPKCRTNVDDRAQFCPVCGEPLAPAAPEYAYPPAAPEYRAPIYQRSIPIAIILSFVTCGFYMLYWIYCMANDLNTASREEDDTSGGIVLLLHIVTCGIYTMYWFYKAGMKVNRIQQFSGKTPDSSLKFLYLILSLFGFSIVGFALVQNELNKVAAE